MKKLMIVMLIVPLFMACNQDEIDRLNQKNDSIASVVVNKDAQLDDFLTTFGEIQANLDSIKAKEQIISGQTSGGGDIPAETKEQIKNDIQSIYQLLIDNKAKLSKLKKRLGNSNWKIKQLDKMIDKLNNQLETKNLEIDSLRGGLENLQIQVADLSDNIKHLKDEKLQTENQLKEEEEKLAKEVVLKNEVWFVVGTKKELLEANVTTKEGGFIGLGKIIKLKSNFDKSIFTKADKRELKTIPAPGKNVTIVTDHPKSSYTFVGEGDDRKLEITDASIFWSVSRYLVVSVK
jgi:chromosome segregation ATPase